MLDEVKPFFLIVYIPLVMICEHFDSDSFAKFPHRLTLEIGVQIGLTLFSLLSIDFHTVTVLFVNTNLIIFIFDKFGT